MRAPNFFIIGAPKCGTTSMARWLSEHPQIYFTDPKETRYFSTDLNVPLRVRDYGALFSGVTDDHVAAGEGSTEYIYSDAAIDRIALEYPLAKIVVMLRNPAELVWSWHKQLLFQGWQIEADFDAAWSAGLNQAALQARNYEAKLLQYQFVGTLGSRLELVIRKFGSSRVHVVTVDDLRRDPQGEFDGVLRFLGATIEHQVCLRPENVGIERRSAILSNVVRVGRGFKHRLQVGGGFGVLSALNRMNRATRKERLPDHTRARLMEYFEPEVRKLERLLDRDFSAWLPRGADASSAL